MTQTALPRYLASVLASLICTLYSCSPPAQSQKDEPKYNFLFIAVDDLNDYTGFLGGHPQAKTPAMDDLASKSIIFKNAFCPAPVCNPSRTAIMTGIMPHTSGVYGNKNFFRDSEVLESTLTIPEYLSENGYHTLARGKIFHHPNGKWSHPEVWDEYEQISGEFGNAAKEPGYMANGMPVGAVDGNFDWGPTDAELESTSDYLNATWASDQLQRDFDQPFFLACGFTRPHLEWKVPQSYFDKFLEEETILPEILETDRVDIPDAAAGAHRNYYGAKKYNKMKAAVRAYLASINYVDDCIKKLLDGLQRSQYADNTVVILWGDHGWHLGEKQRFKKATLWEEATRVPLLIRIPNGVYEGAVCARTVNLVDLYPTIVELAGLHAKPMLQGKSLVPLLHDPDLVWERPALTTMGFRRHSLRSERYRYIQYEDQSEELYDHEKDSMEWNNLAADPNYEDVIFYFRKHLPDSNHPEIVKSSPK